MNIKEIKEGIKDKHWYYYYDFNGVEVNKKKKKDKTLGIHNWNKLKPIVGDLFSKVDSPHVLNIGCNMGLYDHNMTKMGAKVISVDFKTENIEFYKKYIEENKNEKWTAEINNIDIRKERILDDDINIITMCCVLYHLDDDKDNVVSSFSEDIPNHKFIVLQGNLPRVSKNRQMEAGVDGMKSFLKKHDYKIYEVYEWNGYQKPVVIGERQVV